MSVRLLIQGSSLALFKVHIVQKCLQSFVPLRVVASRPPIGFAFGLIVKLQLSVCEDAFKESCQE